MMAVASLMTLLSLSLVRPPPFLHPTAVSTAGRSVALMVAPTAASYGAEQITVLEGLEPVRKRPGMYIGSTGPRGLHHLVFEVVDNSVDEALAGHATRIDVRLLADGSVSVSDDGRGIPCDVHSKTGRPALETVLTVLHAGGKFGDSGYKVSSGLHGVGVSVVNALSSAMHVTVRRSGREHRMAFAQGKVVQEMSVSELAPGEAKQTGTTVVFEPDTSIFKSGLAFDFETLATRFDEQAYLNAGLHITLTDERGARRSNVEAAQGASAEAPDAVRATAPAPAADTADAPTPASRSTQRVFCHEGGIAEYVEHICESKR